MGLFGGGGFFGGGGGFGGGIAGKNPIQREAERQTRQAVERVADKISPNLGNIVKAVNGIQETKDDLLYGKQPSCNIFGYEESARNLSPAFGSLVYCELGFGSMEHSGIYVGGNQIIELDGNGNTKKVSLKQFTGHLTTVNTGIWIPCDENEVPVGLSHAGNLALDMLGSKRNYNLIIDNCHQFSSGCITGDFENADNFLWMLKDTYSNANGSKINWKQWKWN